MQSYGGSENDLSFNLSGVPSFEQKQQQMQLVNEIVKTTLGALHFIAFTFAHVGLQKEIASAYKEF